MREEGRQGQDPVQIDKHEDVVLHAVAQFLRVPVAKEEKVWIRPNRSAKGASRPLDHWSGHTTKVGQERRPVADTKVAELSRSLCVDFYRVAELPGSRVGNCSTPPQL